VWLARHLPRAQPHRAQAALDHVGFAGRRVIGAAVDRQRQAAGGLGAHLLGVIGEEAARRQREPLEQVKVFQRHAAGVE
jgi:hypothetical protein